MAMRKLMAWALAIGVAVLVPDTASAQGRGQGRGVVGVISGIRVLLVNEGVQKELKLTDDQKTKVQELAQSESEKMRELRLGGGQPDRDKLREAQKAVEEATEKFVKETLTPEQQKRLKQLRYQQQGVRAFTYPDVQKALKLTDEQKDKVKTLALDYDKELPELRPQRGGGGGNFQEMMQKRQALRKDYVTKAQALLTDEQKKEWKDLTGEPFEFQCTFQRRRGGGQ
jgi:hypothetical protein